ncbi:MAG: sigma-E processing peptidase SpoIIGA [Lachnospiraceae bacterium]|nr:sigma-E processing peptidase SpoIIGA [Lachnospiraceae bacterium]
MNYEFYADVFFLTNCYLDFLAVYTVSEILRMGGRDRKKKRILRYLICCAVSSLSGCVLFLLIRDYDAYLLCIHSIVNPLLVAGCFFPVGRELYIKAFCLVYFVMLLLGGSVEWLYHTVAGGRYYELCLFAAAVPIAVFLYILRRKREIVRRFYTVRIEHKGKKMELTALYDTGNSLRDPYVKQPVHIVSSEVCGFLEKEETFLTRLIPFSSVGCRNGMLKAFTIERLVIRWEDRQIELAPAVLAVTQEALFEHRNYQMILNNSVSEETGFFCGKAVFRE